MILATPKVSLSAACGLALLAGCASRAPDQLLPVSTSVVSPKALPAYRDHASYAMERQAHYYGVKACPPYCLPPTPKTLVPDPLPLASSLDRSALALPVAFGEPVVSTPLAIPPVVSTPVLSNTRANSSLAQDTQAPHSASVRMPSIQPLLVAHRPARASLDQNSLDAVAALADQFKALASPTNTKLLVVGHADASGSTRANERLAVRRALSIKEALIKAGVASDAIVVRAAPFEYLHSNATPEGRTLNRQTFIRLI